MRILLLLAPFFPRRVRRQAVVESIVRELGGKEDIIKKTLDKLGIEQSTSGHLLCTDIMLYLKNKKGSIKNPFGKKRKLLELDDIISSLPEGVRYYPLFLYKRDVTRTFRLANSLI